jgi:hypothetical protein
MATSGKPDQHSPASAGTAAVELAGLDARVSDDTMTRLIVIQLGDTYRTGHNLPTQGQHPVWFIPKRLRVWCVRRSGVWRIAEVGIVGYPTPQAVSAGATPEVERQRSFREGTAAPMWAFTIARHFMTALP